jgi:hypothetical protein
MPRIPAQPPALDRGDPVEVLRRARRSGGDVVSLSIRLPNDSFLVCAGQVVAINQSHAVLLEATGRTRRVVLGLVDSARVVPPRTASKKAPGVRAACDGEDV